ncbi:molecular chaperone TorD family protein [Halomicrobium salinisoli]|uniref:molecular chaperone TorD family protein n=1 Tax=Halomicrobium salinisoli TaxID=2878391 RepID=UPI001CF06BEF|nr:molecular chaperone TorD family protein [Halomicrobium salinisoli]
MSDARPDGAADPPASVDADAAARGALYALVARGMTDPDPELYDALASGALDDECRRLLDRTTLQIAPPDLTTDEDRETVSARFNDLFVVGHAADGDGANGTVDADGPAVSLYESRYRSDASWNDVNLDLARAYDYFGLAVDEERREHHDHLRLELEFAGYLCRREAAVDADGAASGASRPPAEHPADGAARARLDFLDRHLVVLADGVADALAAEPGTGVFGELTDFCRRLVEADANDLADRLEGDR